MLLVPMALSIASCSDNDDNPVTPQDPDKPSSELADYTIIFYGHGGRNLDEPILGNIAQFYMGQESSYGKVKIAVQYKYSTTENLLDWVSDIDEEEAAEMGSQTVRFVVDPRMAANESEESTPIYGSQNCDITNPDSLTNFINWAAQTCPAKNYILLLSDHGGGYMPHQDLVKPAASAHTRGLIQDDGNGNVMFSVKTVASAIAKASIRPQVIYFDACLMNNVEYQFELKDLTDYLILSSFIVPGNGGDYTALVDELASASNIETALTNYCKASVDRWDRANDVYSQYLGYTLPAYHDMTVTRTSALDGFGQKWKEFTDKLVEAYQSGESVKAAINSVTENYTFKVEKSLPYYDLINYARGLCDEIPSVFSAAFAQELGAAYDATIVYQQSSNYLEENDFEVDCTGLLGANGHYLYTDWDEDVENIEDYYVYHADGLLEAYLGDGSLYGQGNWGGTLASTYEQLAWDKTTGWSRWLKLNEQEPAIISPATVSFAAFGEDQDLQFDPESETVITGKTTTFIRSNIWECNDCSHIWIAQPSENAQPNYDDGEVWGVSAYVRKWKFESLACPKCGSYNTYKRLIPLEASPESIIDF